MKKERREIFYKEYTDDVVESKNQDFKLQENYKWIHKNLFYNILSYIVYAIIWIYGFLYCKLKLKLKIENKNILKKYKNKGYFIYGNHTQEIGDVAIPAIACNQKRIYVVINSANLGIPGIGKIIPMIGGLPIPETISKLKLFNDAICTRISQKKCVVIYPEAHVWPYYTKIRPYNEKAFKYPVNLNAPVFSMTTTYQKSKKGKKVRIVTYIDGPFEPNCKLQKNERIKKLRDDVYNSMNENSKKSNYEYIVYKKVESGENI